MVFVQTVGFDQLSKEDMSHFESLFNNHFKKIQRKIKDAETFVFHLKEYEKEGKRMKFSLHSRIIWGNKMIEANAFDWEFNKTVNKVFNKLEQEIEHKFRDQEHSK